MITRILLVACLISASAVARAADPGGAETLHTKAQEAMVEQRYAEAAELFHAAYELDPAPELLWNEARARHLAGELERARDLYKGFIERDDAPAALRGRANDSIVEITLELEKREQNPVAPVEHDDTFGTAMTIGGGTLIVGGAVAHLLWFAAADDMSTAGVIDDYESARDRRDVARALTWVGYGVGAAALTAGIVSLILTDDPEVTPAGEVTFVPVYAPGFAGLTATLGF